MRQEIFTLLKCASVFILVLISIHSNAQLKGDHLLGDAGLQSGTMAPPSFTIVVPFYNYHTSSFKDKDGHSPSSSPDVNMFVTGIGASIVYPKKIFNADWGVTLLLPFAANKIEGGLVSSTSSLAFSDIYFEPVQLGWKTTQADFTVGYALYIPTGK